MILRRIDHENMRFEIEVIRKGRAPERKPAMPGPVPCRARRSGCSPGIPAVLAGLSLLSSGGADPVSAKTHSRTVTAEMRRNAVLNASRYPWAEKEQQRSVRAAAPWLAMSDRDLWLLPTAQTVPRTVHTTKIEGTNRGFTCPNCGPGIAAGYGFYPWRIDLVKRPWKLQCPNCAEIYPKNDFRAYYLSALDKHGVFQPGKGDPGLLFNPAHPDPNDPLHKFGVDDGYGWEHPEHGRYWFVAYCNAWGQWRGVRKALASLSQAYTLTDDPRYARKVWVLLGRVADLYPAMDLHPYMVMGCTHSEGGTRSGRIEGCIWEADTATIFSLAYDRTFDGMAADPGLVEFLDGMAQSHGLVRKDSFKAIREHIEDNLLLEFAKSVKDGRIRGNEGMYQRAMIAAAIALDRQPTTNELLDWVFRPGKRGRPQPGGQWLFPVSGGRLPRTINYRMDRDGMGDEGAVGYALWGAGLVKVAQLLDCYPDYDRHSVFRDFPKYKHCFLTPARLLCLGQVAPNIGDSGNCGLWSMPGMWAEPLAIAFRAFRDPLLAKRLLQVTVERGHELHGPIHDADPAGFREEVRTAAAALTTEPASVNLNGFGVAIVQTPRPHTEAAKGRALWLYYGRNAGHGHKDRLNLGLFAENVTMLPDLGYPEHASGRPKDILWTKNSISHNVVIVDDQRQKTDQASGHLRLLDAHGKARVVHVESDRIYPGMTTYRRLAVLVDSGPGAGYAADIFWVRGGKTHRQSWHGPPGKLSVAGLNLEEQTRGTFAGEDVEFGKLPEKWRGSTGYMYLSHVRRDRKPPARFSLDFDAADSRGRIAEGRDPHLRLTCLTPTDEVALARGQPPQNKPGNPPFLDYAVLTRSGQELESAFLTIVEPYESTPIVASARRLEVEIAAPGVLATAVEVRLADGRVDTIVAAERPVLARTSTGVELDGVFGIIARRDEQVEFAKVVRGTLLRRGEFRLECPTAEIRGKVLECSTADPADNWVLVELDREPPAPVTGRIVVFRNDRVRDAAYDIVRIEPRGSRFRISLGDKTLIRGYSNPDNYSAPFVLNVNPGDQLRIPLSARFPED